MVSGAEKLFYLTLGIIFLMMVVEQLQLTFLMIIQGAAVGVRKISVGVKKLLS